MIQRIHFTNISRFFYWLVQCESIGPIAINIVRVFFDVVTTLISYLFILIAFTFGFLMLMYYYIHSRHTDPDGIDDTKRRFKGLKMLMPKVMVELVWVTMDPGDVEWGKINIINDTTAYPNGTGDSLFGNQVHADFARAFLITFELVSAIILINLLIAAMNNTGL